MALPWDVCATPIEARKLARLGMERGEVVLRPAFFSQLGAPYGAVSRARCPIHDHDAPHADCRCGFHAVATDDQLWRLGADEPDLALLDVELAGQVIEHDHGYRASDQRTLAVWVHPTCARCGRSAELLHQRRFGTLVPACRHCARRPVRLDTAGASLGAPVRFSAEDVPRGPWGRRLCVVLASMVLPLAVLVAACVLAVVAHSAVPLAFGQIAVAGWLVTGTSVLLPFADRLGLAPAEAVRLQQRWSPMVLAVVIGCELALSAVVIALRETILF